MVDGVPDGGKTHDLTDTPSAFIRDYAPEKMVEIVSKLYKNRGDLGRPWGFLRC